MKQSANLSCTNLSCGYPGRTVLTGVSFELEPGTVTALLGPNGSGKSTLLKSLIRIIPSVDGIVMLEDVNLSSLSFKQIAQTVAYVPQEESPQFPFLVRDFVAMGRLALSQSYFDSAEDVREAEKAIGLADCKDLSERVVTELSGGEMQRVLIARALAQNTKIILMDEPTSHMDAGHVVYLTRLLKQLSDSGTTVLMALHDLNLALRIATRGILLAKGRVLLDETMTGLLKSPDLALAYGVSFKIEPMIAPFG